MSPYAPPSFFDVCKIAMFMGEPKFGPMRQEPEPTIFGHAARHVRSMIDKALAADAVLVDREWRLVFERPTSIPKVARCG